MATLDKAYIEDRIAVMPSGCWHWLYAEDGHGYGVNGRIPNGLVVRHKCNNPICVNPDHLVLGTHFDNSQDTIAAGATPAGSRNGMSKLTLGQVQDIRTSFPATTRKALALRHSITLSMVCKILNRKTWSHIK